MGRTPILDPERDGTLGPQAALAEALASDQDFAAQAAAISAALDRVGVAPGAALLSVGCGHGHLLAALRERYAVAGCDRYDARLMLARRRLSGVPLWQTAPADLTAAWPAQVVLIEAPAGIADLTAALTAAAGALTPGGVLLLMGVPDDLTTGTARMLTHDGDGLKIVRSEVVRCTGGKARLDSHWMAARDHQGVVAFAERHTLHLHSSAHITEALTTLGFSSDHLSEPALPYGLWLATR